MAGEDRISLLPDELLHHILSFLHSTKDRAQTSLLSSRFRHLWAHHPDLHLSMRHSLNPDELESIAQSYVLTVDSCLRSFAAPSLRSFTIDLWLPTSCPHAVFKAHSKVADRWLRFAGLHSVLKLSLHPRSQIGEGYARIPSSLFCCRSIEDLFLMYGTFPAVPRNFKGFLNLKKLHIGLSSVWDDTLADLLDCCPALEILKLVGCRGLTSVEVSPRNLPRLREVLLFNDESMEASIDAPNLSYINFTGNFSNLDWNSSSVLSKASLTDKTEVGFQNLDDWMKMIGAISNVALLKVNSWFFQFEIPKDYLNGPMFKNLKELYCDIDWISGSVLRALTCNLGECPLLEILYIELSREKRSAIKNSVQKANSENSEDETDISSGLPCFRHKDALLKCVEDEYEQDEWDPLEHISELDSSFCHLKTITLKEFLGSKNEMRLAAYLLRKAIALEEFIIFDFLMRGELELEEAFARVPRASSQVQMKFSPWWNMLYSLWPSWRKFC